MHPLLWMCIISIKAPKSEPALELISRAVPSVEAHHRSVGPDVRRRIKDEHVGFYQRVFNPGVKKI